VIWRAIVVWLAVLVLANLNGAVREAWLIPYLGPGPGRVLSTVILSALVFLVTWLTIGWIRPATTRDALLVGVLWLVLTLAFEFLVGHYVFHKPWIVLLEDYDLSRGRIWVAVLVVVLLAPLWTARMRGLFSAAGSR
jgi:hypothetical protein